MNDTERDTPEGARVLALHAAAIIESADLYCDLDVRLARAHLAASREDTRRLDELERMANQPGGILLHDGSETGRLGIGLRPGALVRTLRQAIDDAAPSPEEA